MEKDTEKNIDAVEQELTENLRIYNQLRSVPPEAIKPIGAGRLKGMSDVNPMWRIHCLTAAFGPCGFGWRYEITKQWTEAFGNEVKAYCNINLFIKVNDEWSAAIPGTGGSSEVSQERNGQYVSDECYKMALTDALSVAMKALGVAADVYFSKGKNIVDPSTKYAYDEQQAKGELPGKPQSKLIQQEINASDIFQAEQFIKQATSANQLKWIYETFVPLQKDKNFLAMCTARRKELGL